MNLVVGSTGLLGGMVTSALLQRGAPVRVLLRNASDAASGADVARGDLKDPVSLQAACAGVSTVITTANSAQRGGEDNVESVDLQGNLTLIAAAKHAGVRHFIFVSAAFVDEASPVPLFAAKARVEKALRESGISWTIVAPHVFMDVWFPAIIGSALGAGKAVSLVAGGRRRHSFVAVADVAAVIAACVDNPAVLNRRLVLGGPEALSWTEIVAKAEALVARPIATEAIEPGSPIPSLPPPIDQVIGNLAAGLEQQDVILDTTELARELGVTLTPADTVLGQML